MPALKSLMCVGTRTRRNTWPSVPLIPEHSLDSGYLLSGEFSVHLKKFLDFLSRQMYNRISEK